MIYNGNEKDNIDSGREMQFCRFIYCFSDGL